MIMKAIFIHSAAAITLLAAASAGSLEDPIIAPTPDAPSSEWEFRASPYGWLTGLDGTVGVGGLTGEINQSFSDILPNLKMAAALQFEARNGRWGIIADGFYADMGASSNPPGPLYDYVNVDIKQFLGELDVAYRVYEGPSGFVDIYAGLRYNNLSGDFEGNLNTAGIQAASDNASSRIVTGIKNRADAIVQPRAAAFAAGTAAERTAIETQLTADIEAEADGRIKRDLEKQLLGIRRSGGLDARDIASAKISLAVKARRLELATSTAELKVAQLRASVDSSLQAAVATARSRVKTAEQKLATAINNQLVKRLPTSASATEEWVDPIVGCRAQWNINPKWYLAGKTDIGGFGVGSDLVWTVQGTVGYNFTDKVSADLGYRYMHTDYTDGGFTYDVATSGIYTSLNIKF